jgi:hypothetical protein
VATHTRREFIATFGGVVVALPLAARRTVSRANAIDRRPHAVCGERSGKSDKPPAVDAAALNAIAFNREGSRKAEQEAFAALTTAGVEFVDLRTARTITESQSGVMRRSDSGLGDSSARRTGVDRSHDRRGRHSAALGRGRFEARRAGAAIICGG